jgi:hypothetical protein
VREAYVLLRCALNIVTYTLGAPFTIFYSKQIVCEAQIIGELLQQVDAETGAALV